MALQTLDWLIVAAYVVFALVVGVVYAKRANQNADEFFLSGRTLPWWIAGTSMVATSFAADTPLLLAGWVRDHGIWKNWIWWCYCGGGMLAVFLFARGWRRGGMMTKAELAELRYGGNSAKWLRGVLGLLHAGFTNTMILCWVLLAARKIMEVLLGIDGNEALLYGCLIALSYSLLAGFWGVVMTDMVQFVMAMFGSIALAVLSWNAVGGSEAVMAAAEAGAPFTENTLRFFPAPGEGSMFDSSFWTAPFTAALVYLGLYWWAAENVDGSGTTVQRIAASKDERQGVLAVMWFNVAHYALRPWPWILVGVASLLVLPPLVVNSPVTGQVTEVRQATHEIVIQVPDAAEQVVSLTLPESADDWQAEAVVSVDDEVVAGDALAKSDSERAYVVMMRRYLPTGLLGLVVASLLAAFMSTIDTHVNLAASFFVNDIYRRFFKKDGEPKHYVLVARIASVLVLCMAGVLAMSSTSISELFQFFLSFLAGVGPIYLLRWHWWRIRAHTEIVAMLASAVAAACLRDPAILGIDWSLGPLSPDGVLTSEGRMVVVVAFSLACAIPATLFGPKADPSELVEFYRRVKPAGWWGPVAALAPDIEVRQDKLTVLAGFVGGLALIYGLMLATGFYFLGTQGETAGSAGIAAIGGFMLWWALGRADRESTRA
jgi:solute:Na+ symporter, SSS family